MSCAKKRNSAPFGKGPRNRELQHTVISSLAKDPSQILKLEGSQPLEIRAGESANRGSEGLQVRNGRCHNSQLPIVAKIVEVYRGGEIIEI